MFSPFDAAALLHVVKDSTTFQGMQIIFFVPCYKHTTGETGMTTKEMLQFMKEEGYPLTLMAAQSGVDYFALYRHLNNGKSLTMGQKAAVWRFGMCQPKLEARIKQMARAEDTRREKK